MTSPATPETPRSHSRLEALLKHVDLFKLVNDVYHYFFEQYPTSRPAKKKERKEGKGVDNSSSDKM